MRIENPRRFAIIIVVIIVLVVVALWRIGVIGGSATSVSTTPTISAATTKATDQQAKIPAALKPAAIPVRVEKILQATDHAPQVIIQQTADTGATTLTRQLLEPRQQRAVTYNGQELAIMQTGSQALSFNGVCFQLSRGSVYTSVISNFFNIYVSLSYHVSTSGDHTIVSWQETNPPDNLPLSGRFSTDHDGRITTATMSGESLTTAPSRASGQTSTASASPPQMTSYRRSYQLSYPQRLHLPTASSVKRCSTG